MGDIVLAGSTSGTVTISPPASAGTTTLTLPATTGTVLTTGAVVTKAQGGTGVSESPAFAAWASASQTLSSGVFTKIQCNTEEFDTNSNYDNTTYRFTPTVAGYYQLTGAFYINTGSSGGESILSIHKNGSEFKRGVDIGNNTAGSIYQITVSALVYLNGSTDYVEMYGYMSTGHTSGNGQAATYFQGFLARSA